MKIGRNDSCHCGSGAKYKRCCLEKDEALRRAADGEANQAASAASAVDKAILTAIEPMLKMARTREERERAFGIGAVAGEIALVDDPQAREEVLRTYLEGAFHGSDAAAVDLGRNAFRAAVRAVLEQIGKAPTGGQASSEASPGEGAR
jgi:hypothetical protein